MKEQKELIEKQRELLREILDNVEADALTLHPTMVKEIRKVLKIKVESLKESDDLPTKRLCSKYNKCYEANVTYCGEKSIRGCHSDIIASQPVENTAVEPVEGIAYNTCLHKKKDDSWCARMCNSNYVAYTPDQPVEEKKCEDCKFSVNSLDKANNTGAMCAFCNDHEKWFEQSQPVPQSDIESFEKSMFSFESQPVSTNLIMKLKLWNVDFEPMYPVGGCLIILAYDEAEAKRIASMTIQHTAVFTVEEIPMDKPSVIIYQSGDY
jgi:hypothetical protein